MSRSGGSGGDRTFQITLRRALEHVDDPVWLTANSPLATPYFLGKRSPPTTEPHNDANGRVLQALLHETADSFWEGGPPPTRAALMGATDEARQSQGNAGDEYAFLLLELRYFRRYFPSGDYPEDTVDMPHFLAVSETRLFVHLTDAVDRLSERLLRRVQPALRLEQPQLPETFVGRARELRELSAALDAGRGVSLTGPPGAGKTTLSAVAGLDWPGGRVFRYTFLPGLNDTPGALLFALGHFAQTYGATALWSYLLSVSGEAPDLSRATGLLRADLDEMSDARPLLILDEIDLLRTADGEPRSVAHSQLLFFVEALIDMAPLLLIGQRSYVDTPEHMLLSSLDEDGVAALLDGAGTHLPPSLSRRVYEVTGGLPRLVWLVVALLRSGEDIEEMTRLPLRGDATPLFHRLWRRLDQEEKELLVALSAFRRAAPGDVWSRHPLAVANLAERRLLTMGETGEIALQPFFQRLVYQELRPEQRERFHIQAGHIRAERGEYAAAAYHYVRANEPELAISTWFPQRDLELSRGLAGAAQDVFTGLSSKGLSTKATRQLNVIQNQLHLLSGEAALVSENVRSITWDMDDRLTAEAYLQAARANTSMGNSDEALDDFARSSEVLAQTVRRIVDNHFFRAGIMEDESDLRSARREAVFAEQRLAFMHGELAYYGNEYETALAHYQEALRLADVLGQGELAAECKRTIAGIYGVMGDVPQAEQLLQEAIDYYDHIGDRMRVEVQRMTLGGVYINARMFEKAIPPSEQALAFFERMGRTLQMHQPILQLAEAYLETGQYEKSIEYAYRGLNLEMPLYRPYAFYTLGLAQQRLGKPDVAEAAFTEGIESARRNNDRFIEAYLHRNMGRLRREQGDETAARESLSAALALFQAIKIPHEIAETEGEIILN